MKEINKHTTYDVVNYEDKDYELIYDFKKVSYKKYVESIWGAWDDIKQHEFFEKYINAQKSRIKIIVIDGKKIGYVDDQMIDENTYEIVNICILPEYQGKGIGTNILKQMLEEHKQYKILIQCFIENPVSKLYERLGFKEYERSKTHIKLSKAGLYSQI